DRGRAARARGRARSGRPARGRAHVHRDARRGEGRVPHRHHGLARPVRRGRSPARRVPYADAVIEAFRVLAEAEDLPRWDVPEALATLYGGALGTGDTCGVGEP